MEPLAVSTMFAFWRMYDFRGGSIHGLINMSGIALGEALVLVLLSVYDTDVTGWEAMLVTWDLRMVMMHVQLTGKSRASKLVWRRTRTD
jgi:hypothetical protein